MSTDTIRPRNESPPPRASYRLQDEATAPRAPLPSITQEAVLPKGGGQMPYCPYWKCGLPHWVSQTNSGGSRPMPNTILAGIQPG